ncbi:hypothetical protein UFOVP1377_21 [uncultured Caudovirales phage]|uniref:Uncharacterized protein n=1 Tax=uncultured Caudovirales phage TaxID=2100421 RepID=A0A6J5RZ16_9CAUD|nr:hypothetical protein UFOVP604_17 [uncultured Caudovirales phage]CAB4183883.1 hypothetical protein UFOVP1108_17 [uncultured Caudovirales phage]CAB4202402.1 hypothetical protein UFOVP1377_21 [uncultured Caudovirales phage]CAB4215652.1 hypothetical protein UFOVP1472_30 [uncultured Caudovirales phage]CAB5229754.1 hypothetical protein UFOVP1559_8 [uncultured Caudovirales phage]
MPAPIDYGVQIADPTQSFLSAFQAGTSIQDAQFKQQQQVQQAAQQKLIQAGFAKLQSPNATAADYANLSMMLPETQAKAVRESFGMLTEDRQKTALQQSGQIFSAFEAKQPEIAISLMDQQIAAKQNTGDTAGADFLKKWRDVAKETPEATKIFFGNMLTQIPGGDKVIENSIKLSGERRAVGLEASALRQSEIKAQNDMADLRIKLQNEPNNAKKLELEAQIKELELQQAQVKTNYAEREAAADLKKKAADLGLTTQQASQALAATKKLSEETKKIVLEIAALKDGVDPAKKFEQEEKLRKEYQGRTKVYSELGSTYSNIESSAKAKTGPGDVALITGFMKMLDPGSVVRETEFATARDTAGLYIALENALKKAQNGQFLQSDQRKNFVDLAKQYLDSAQAKAIEDKKALGIVVKNYKLNPENVFGQEPPPLPTSATVGGQTYARPPGFTDTQWRDYLKAQGVNP